ncbi:MAG TPA: hypothetical protein VE779_05955 [Candidatus Angelobacter sp.]|jgi:hypothetical protein|nr:hypothetical protein [Candidatus Angelobacter sp.]
MVALSALWLPIVLAAVIVFFGSFVMHMLLTYHRSDYKQLPGEEKVMAAIREAGVSRGLYMFPHTTHAEMKSEVTKAKFEKGPVGTLNVRQSGPVVMGKFLGQWFGFCLIVSFFTAYIAAHTLAPAANYLEVFRVVGAVAFMAYGLSQLANGIWKGEPWGMVIKETVDGLVYGLLTAGTFGWLWPR